jgi:hypothetical protein
VSTTPACAVGCCQHTCLALCEQQLQVLGGSRLKPMHDAPRALTATSSAPQGQYQVLVFSASF